jgi:hypothetical protein
MNLKDLWNKTLGKAAYERRQLIEAIKKEDEFYDIKSEILKQSPSQSVTYNMWLNGHPCVCTEKSTNGLLASILYEYDRPQLTLEEQNEQFQGKIEFTEQDG